MAGGVRLYKRSDGSWKVAHSRQEVYDFLDTQPCEHGSKAGLCADLACVQRRYEVIQRLGEFDG